MSPTATRVTDATEQAQPKAAPEPAPVKAVATATPKSTGKTSWQIVQLGVDLIDPSPYQPRLTFDPIETAELVASVKERGVQQPILVRTAKADLKAKADPAANGTHANGSNGKNGSGKLTPSKRTRSDKLVRFELIAGERRLRACKEAGRKQIPAILRDDLSDRECAELALLDNIQRSNLSVIEEARGYKQLMIGFGMKEERIARKVGKSVQTIQHTLKLLALPEPVQGLLTQKKLSASHGHELLPLAPFERLCLLVAGHVVDNRLTAASLQANPLPNAQDLKRKGLLQELDFHTKFEWKQICQNCPHKALVKSGYSSYCLRPEEWKAKQDATIAQAKDETARALEQVKAQVREQIEEQEQVGRVDASALPPGSYRNLSVTNVPQGCGEHCPCRRESSAPHDPSLRVPICIDPARLKSLQEQERQAHEEKRRLHYTRLWEQANQILQDERPHPRKTVSLLTGIMLGGELHRYGYDAEHGALARSVARALNLSLPWDELLEAEDESAMFPLLAPSLPTEGTHDRETNGAPTEATEILEPSQLLLFAASLLLVQEVRQAVRFGGETPRLSFVLGPEHEAQLELPSDGDEPEAPEPDDEMEMDSDEEFDSEECDSPEEDEPFDDEEQDEEQPENDSDL